MAHTRPTTPPRQKKDLENPWELGDTIPAPDAVHSDGDTAWALFNELAHQQEQRFADTAPMTQPPLNREEASWAATQPASRNQPLSLVPIARGPSQLFFSLESAMLVARRNNRVCPRPERWTEFSALLSARKTARGLQQPPAAATGPAWAVTAPLTKRMCFREQIEWAEQAGALEDAIRFMHSISEDEWLHMGED
jgi:hypothetical protein